jgi:tRNA pseudouridine13 synthase
MKLKRLPEDFQVEEQIALEASGGPFALYRLTKQGIGTPEAIDALVVRWKLARQAVAYAGLKDKHALTTQYVTVHNGPRRGLSQTNMELEYVGQTNRPIHAHDITGNRFDIVIRDLSDADIQNATGALAAISTDGLPNYFDDQRFGSLGISGEFIAKPWCLGDYERALWLALADENVHDRPADRAAKQSLRQHWGDWALCKELLASSRLYPILAHLANTGSDFRRALALVRQDVRSIWLAAFQSHLWNQILATLLQETCRKDQLQLAHIGQRDLPFFTQLNDAQRRTLYSTSLPLPSARLHLENGPLNDFYQRVLAAEGMELRQIRVKYPRDSFFSKGDRPAVSRPLDLAHESADDELQPERRKLTLRFTLARAAYATIVVKRLTGGPSAHSAGGDEDF